MLDIFEKLDSGCSFDATPWTAERRYTALAMKKFLRRDRSHARARRPRVHRAGRAAAGRVARRRRLTIEQLIDIRHPSNPVWSPDGRHVAFLSERAGIANIFVADVTASSSTPAGARALTRYADGQGAGFFWSADSQRVYFPRQGDLWQVALSGGEPSAVWSTPQAESSITLSPDGTRVAFVRRPRRRPAPASPAAGEAAAAVAAAVAAAISSSARSPTDESRWCCAARAARSAV